MSGLAGHGPRPGLVPLQFRAFLRNLSRPQDGASDHPITLRRKIDRSESSNTKSQPWPASWPQAKCCKLQRYNLASSTLARPGWNNTRLGICALLRGLHSRSQEPGGRQPGPEPGQQPHPPHTHPDEEIMAVTEGSGQITMNATTSNVGPGAVCMPLQLSSRRSQYGFGAADVLLR